jgi:7-keto-8-aminopelargonate synthetase-like enzyme
MPRDSPSNTEYAYKIIASLKTLFKSLPPSSAYISIFQKYCEYILNQRSAIYHATNILPILAALIVIQVERDLDHAKQLHEIRNQYSFEIARLRNEISELRREIKEPTTTA